MTTPGGWTRAEHASRLEQTDVFDVVVIGGGVTGAGAALDLAARGLHVGLVERSDFAQGTSSRSTKLFHGGIRYLPQFHFGLVSEGLREQKVLARIADFLYRPLEFVIPLYTQYGIADAPAWAARGWMAPLALRAGLIAYDALGGTGRPGSRHRSIRAEELLASLPTLRHEGLTGGFVYSDAQTDDARLVVSLLKTAVVRYAATVVNQIEVESVESIGRSFRVHLLDRGTSERFTTTARAVLSATGAFDPPDLADGGARLELVRSKGSHLIVDSDVLGLGHRALVLPETDDGRVLYIVPWLNHSMIGTTDTPYTAEPTHPTASVEDNAYLIRHVRRYLDVEDFEPLSSFAGLRALKDVGAGTTAQASREHVIEEPVAGYVQVAGGKLTTYRRIAAEAANAVASSLGVAVRSSTDSIPLIGAGADHERLAAKLRSAGADPSVIGPTIARNGGDAERVADLMAADADLAAPLGDGRTSLADVVHAVRHEGAGRISDVTLRRTHLAWFTPDHARADARWIADVMAAELGWSRAEQKAQLDAHELELVAEAL
ncbi:MAG TPA: glycerol-3-phosphate dehydrogenase/oxidase [Acidimicrobiia bacterium]|nr:glycerol-3-phosphate dehydrogenase/oxidase [Acidimicrobiia bacterium]